MTGRSAVRGWGSCRGGQWIAAGQAKLAGGLVRRAAPRTHDHLKNSRARAMPRHSRSRAVLSIPVLSRHYAVKGAGRVRTQSGARPYLSATRRPLALTVGRRAGLRPRKNRVRIRTVVPTNKTGLKSSFSPGVGRACAHRTHAASADFSGLFRLGCGRPCRPDHASSRDGRGERRP